MPADTLGCMSKLCAFNFQQWIEQHRDLLRPPVGNKCLFQEGTFIIMVVGGPNARSDFHVNQSDEFFYQLQGDIFLRVIEEGKVREIPIRAGEVFLLPAGLPHSPQRSSGSLGLVVEKRRQSHERDGLQWYCSKCHHKLYEEFFYLQDIETQFAGVFERYYDSNHSVCNQCGHRNGRQWNVED